MHMKQASATKDSAAGNLRSSIDANDVALCAPHTAASMSCQPQVPG